MKYKPNLVRAPHSALDEEVLKNLGFKRTKTKGPVPEVVWRIKIPYYHSLIQVKLGPYPASNPNCGIVSLYSPEVTAPVYYANGRKKMVTFPERTTNIASYVNTPERLRNIIVSLTQQNI